jgi:hypothetical protein
VSTTANQHGLSCDSTVPGFADTVIQATGASGTQYGDPQRAVNGVRGAGMGSGSLDVFSLDKTQDGAIILRWRDRGVCNGPGTDLNVFENAFVVRNGGTFFEPIIVSVSRNGIDFEEFPHRLLGDNSPAATHDAANWQGFAGINPVLYNEDTNNSSRDGINPMEPAQAGGDTFDLDQLPDTEVGRDIKVQGFIFLKLLAAPKAGYPNPAMTGFADIDGVYAPRFYDD